MGGARGRIRASRLSELIIAAAASGAVTAVMIWPQIRHLTTTIPRGAGDPYLQAWEVQWVGHALITQPTHIFDTNAAWPLKNSLAFTEPLLGFAPIGALGSGVTAAIIHYNILFFLAFATAMFAGYLLVRQVGGSAAAGYLGGALIAFAPWRFDETVHLNILFTSAIPLSLACLARGHGIRLDGRRGVQRPWWALAGWLIATWQILTSLSMGLAFAYLLCIAMALFYLKAIFVARTRRAGWKLTVLTSIGLGLFLLASVLIIRPYLQVRHDYPESHRSLQTALHYEARLTNYIAPAGGNVVWRGSLARVAAAHHWYGHSYGTFLGFTAMACAIVGLFYSHWTRRWRLAIFTATTVFFVLTLGPGSSLGALYRLLYSALPGWNGDRTPGRLVMWVTLGAAVLAAGAVDRAVAASKGWHRPTLIHISTLALLAAVLLEGLTSLPNAEPVPAAPHLTLLPQPILVLPSRGARVDDSVAQIWSTDGFPSIVNWDGGLTPRAIYAVTRAAQTAPFAPATVKTLRSDGVKTLVVNLAAPLSWTTPSTKLRWRIPSAAQLRALGMHEVTAGADSVGFVIDPAPTH